MKVTHSYNIGIGVLAGIIAALIGIFSINLLMFLPIIALLLACLISLPIFIAAFSQGTTCSFIAVLSASLVLLLSNNIAFALGFILLFFMPAFYAAWLLGFAQYDEKGKIISWYPLSSLLLTIGTFIAMICALISIFISYQPETAIVAVYMADVYDSVMMQIQPSASVDLTVFRSFFIKNFASITAGIFALYACVFFIGNLYFSLEITKKIQRLARPKENWSSNLYLPSRALIILAVAFLAIIFRIHPTITIISVTFFVIFFVIFVITGLAYIHKSTRNIQGRTFILTSVYIALFIPFIAIIIVIILLLLGIWSTMQHSRQNGGLKL